MVANGVSEDGHLILSGAEVPQPSPDQQLPEKEQSQESPVPTLKDCPFPTTEQDQLVVCVEDPPLSQWPHGPLTRLSLLGLPSLQVSTTARVC